MSKKKEESKVEVKVTQDQGATEIILMPLKASGNCAVFSPLLNVVIDKDGKMVVTIPPLQGE